MTRAAKDPLQNLSAVRERINRLFEAAATRTDFETAAGGDPGEWSPVVDLYETPSEVVLVAEVPGLARAALDVKVTDTSLMLTGARPETAEEPGIVYHRVERPQGRFSRTFHLSQPIDRERVSAEYRLGLLTVTLPKGKQPRPRSIRVTP
jgi:HSP20 family protein